MADLYCVFGNPIAHSKSPAIHAQFAAQTGHDLIYEARLAPVGGFAAAVAELIAQGSKGANVTVPFKEDAYRLATRLTDRARRAGAVNTLMIEAGGIVGDNTDGAGLVQDVTLNLGVPLAGKRVLLLGAGGAVRGVMAPILQCQPASLCLANRSPEKAQALARHFADLAPVQASAFEELAGQSFDVVINGTSASLGGETLPLPDGVFAPACLAYDMMYGKGDTPFMAQARAAGASRAADGLGMLVGQAAEAFALWRGVRPDTGPVLAQLRAALAS